MKYHIITTNKGITMSNDSHLVPVLIQQMIETYNNPKTNPTERFQIESRLRSIQNAIMSTIDNDTTVKTKDNLFK